MSFDVQVLKMGQCDVPGPEVYWMSHWDTWETLYFYMVVIQGQGKTAIVNTGPPADLTALNEVWRHFAGPRCQMLRAEDERPAAALATLGIAPEDVDFVLLTPLQAYATANIALFRNARICVSKRGWIEDFHVPKYPMHIPRELRIPDEALRYIEFEATDKLRLLDDEDEIIPGLRAFWAGVHHRSSMAYTVDTPAGRVIASDCFFKYGNVEEMHPLGILESMEECFRTYERLRREGDILIPLYDPEVLNRYPGGRVARRDA
jgi:glyoxylase-like metal-dependent hydrolase (beta-lactamase superfamily II)